MYKIRDESSLKIQRDPVTGKVQRHASCIITAYTNCGQYTVNFFNVVKCSYVDGQSYDWPSDLNSITFIATYQCESGSPGSRYAVFYDSDSGWSVFILLSESEAKIRIYVYYDCPTCPGGDPYNTAQAFWAISVCTEIETGLANRQTSSSSCGGTLYGPLIWCQPLPAYRERTGYGGTVDFTWDNTGC